MMRQKYEPIEEGAPSFAFGTMRRCRLVDAYVAGPAGRMDVPVRVSANGAGLGRGDFIPAGATVLAETKQGGPVVYSPVIVVEWE